MILNANLFLNKCKVMLSVIGIWMLPHRSHFYKVCTAGVIVLHISFFICNLIHMGVVWGDVDQMSEGSYLLFTHFSTCCKSTNFVFRKDTFGKLLDRMDEKVFKSKSVEHDTILIKHSTRVNKLYIVWIISIVFNCLLWGITPQLNKAQKILPFNIWMPGDMQSSPSYEVAYVLQMIMITNAAQLFLALDVVFIALVMFLCAQLEIIMVDTQKIQNVPLSGLSKKERSRLMQLNSEILIDCIRQHQAVNRFLKDIANMFHIPIFIQISGSIMIVCVVMFRISVESPNTVHFYSTLTYFGLMLAQLYMYCWSTHELTITSERLRDWVYQCPWYDGDVRFRQNLIIALGCMKRPMMFHAGHYISLSRPTFVAILRSSYSYFAVLNQAQATEK